VTRRCSRHWSRVVCACPRPDRHFLRSWSHVRIPAGFFEPGERRVAGTAHPSRALTNIRVGIVVRGPKAADVHPRGAARPSLNKISRQPRPDGRWSKSCNAMVMHAAGVRPSTAAQGLAFCAHSSAGRPWRDAKISNSTIPRYKTPACSRLVAAAIPLRDRPSWSSLSSAVEPVGGRPTASSPSLRSTSP